MNSRVDAISHNWHKYYRGPHRQRTRSVLLTLTDVYYTLSGTLLMNITHLSVLKAFSLSLCDIAGKQLHSCQNGVETEGGDVLSVTVNRCVSV